MHDLIYIKIPDSFIGFGAINKLPEIATSFSAQSILITTDAGIVKAGIMDKITEQLKKAKLHFDIYAHCEPEPSFTSIELLGNEIRNGAYDLIIGLGGGSVMDATKIASQLALNRGITVLDLLHGKTADKVIIKVLIPTTAGTGSEWSNVAVVYDDKAKNEEDITQVYISVHNFADAVIIDPSLVIDLPQRITADTGMDALTHAIEAFTSPKANAISDMFASKAIRLIASNLRLAYGQGKHNLEARYSMSIAASLAMNAAVISSLGMAHFTNGPLGKKAKISHGMACTIMLPHVMRFNLVANPAKFAQVAEIMGESIQGLSIFEAATKAVEAVTRLASDVGMRLDLKDIRFTNEDIDAMVQSVHSHAGPIIKLTNVREATPEDTRRLFMAAIQRNS